MQLTMANAARCAALLALALRGASAGHVGRAATQAQLRAGASGPDASAPADDVAWAARVGSVLKGEALMLVGAHGDEAEGGAAGNGPVSMQVPEEEVKELVSALSTKCGEQFSDILKGKAAPIHRFDAHGANSTKTQESCTRLNGSLCVTQAHVSQTKDIRGRAVTSTVNVEGDGCLPSQCMGKGDLPVLARFMQTKAKDSIPGMGTEVELEVDCTRSGGAMIAVGGKEKAAPAAATPAAVRSGAAARLTAGASTLVVALGLAL